MHIHTYVNRKLFSNESYSLFLDQLRMEHYLTLSILKTRYENHCQIFSVVRVTKGENPKIFNKLLYLKKYVRYIIDV